LFDEDPVKPFAIINLWTTTSFISVIEIFFLNSIRRQAVRENNYPSLQDCVLIHTLQPVTAHMIGVMLVTSLYLVWAGLGKIATGHAGLFFVDPGLMKGELPGVIAACVAFVTLSVGCEFSSPRLRLLSDLLTLRFATAFSYMYGLIAMRETMTAAHRDHSSR
jgi:hypothetical protein